ncbi:MAG TPA: urease accessory UreF family protein, partial [Nitrospiria bacterium]|nr:urease accessory UreF family protein [Nitrospiria bacterium]
VADGRVRSEDDVAAYLGHLLRDGVATCDAVAVAAAHRALEQGDVASLVDVDWNLEAFKFAREAREGSRVMGRRYLEWGVLCAATEGLRQYEAAIRHGDAPGHAATALGSVLAACGWSRQDAIGAALYQTAVGWVSAAIRLMPVGQRGGQRVLASLLPVIESAAREAESGDVGSMRSWTPMHDIRMIRHERQPTRLFRS